MGAIRVGHVILEDKAQPDLGLIQASILISTLDEDFEMYLLLPPPLPPSPLTPQGSLSCPLPVRLHRGVSQSSLPGYTLDGATPGCTGFPLLPEENLTPLRTVFPCLPLAPSHGPDQTTPSSSGPHHSLSPPSGSSPTPP